MPKQKTHSGTKKRFRITGGGKIMHEQQNNQHKFETKSASRKHRLDKDVVLSPAEAKRIRRLLGK